MVKGKGGKARATPVGEVCRVGKSVRAPFFFVEGNRICIGRAEGVGRSFYRVGKKDKAA